MNRLEFEAKNVKRTLQKDYIRSHKLAQEGNGRVRMDVSPKSKFRRLIRFSTGTRCSFSSGTIKHVLLTETQGEEWAAAHPMKDDFRNRSPQSGGRQIIRK